MGHPTLITDTLLLRPFLPADAPEIFALNADPQVMRYLPKDEVFSNVETAQEFLLRYLENGKEQKFLRQAVIRKADGQWLGWCGLKEHPDGAVDLGFRLHAAYWGNGYATAAGAAWVAYGFEQAGLRRMVANAAAGNLGSQRVLEKLGFARAATDDYDEDGFHWLRYQLEKQPVVFPGVSG